MIAGVVLAAGSGTRIGIPKALLRTANDRESFLERACVVLRDGGADEIVVVIGAEYEAARPLPPHVRGVINPDPSRGQLSSLHCALRVVGVDRCEAMIVLPVDVPLVRAATVMLLLEAWRRTRAAVTRPVRGTEHGHPVVFDRAVFAELEHADPARGAKEVVRAHASAAGEVTVADAGAFTDVDTAEDYVKLFGRLPQRAAVR